MWISVHWTCTRGKANVKLMYQYFTDNSYPNTVYPDAASGHGTNMSVIDSAYLPYSVEQSWKRTTVFYEFKARMKARDLNVHQEPTKQFRLMMPNYLPFWSTKLLPIMTYLHACLIRVFSEPWEVDRKENSVKYLASIMWFCPQQQNFTFYSVVHWLLNFWSTIRQICFDVCVHVKINLCSLTKI